MGEARLQACFASTKGTTRKTLAVYITAGHPDIERSRELLLALPEAGADIIELGMPFSDPMADGPIIQKASKRALEGGMNLKGTLALAAEFRQHHATVPLVLMGYYNPIYHYGNKNFAAHAAAAGVDATLIVDLPPESESELRQFLEPQNLCTIRLLAPTTPATRAKTILSSAQGFAYFISIRGITGAQGARLEAIEKNIEIIKPYCSVPLLVGFGVRSPTQAGAIAALSDGVVVGSAVVEACAAEDSTTGNGIAKALSLVESLARAVHRA